MNEWITQYHQTDYQRQERGQKYYSKLIHTLIPSKNQFLLFGENSTFNNLYLFQQNNKNVSSILFSIL